jgi:NAD(P) transhydrogenase subunit alpha
VKVAVPKERRKFECRVAATPDTAKKFIDLGAHVVVEHDAGRQANYADQQYRDAGAEIADTEAETLSGADVVLKVQSPLAGDDGETDELCLIQDGAVLVGLLAPFEQRSQADIYAKLGISAFAMELMPRITRAQGMDVLSSQSNLAGYRSVLDAAVEFDRALPMMMTAAGTVAPARVFVLGAGVAGLQAIATAKRLGAIVSATDVRLAAKEQVESLGASFVMVEDDEAASAETIGGYAKEMSDEFKRKQAELVRAHLKRQDIVITTALIPGRAAPTLIDDDMVHSMNPGSVIVDLAVEAGGNCTMSRPGEIVDVNGVKVIGFCNMPSRVAEDASALYARNLFNFLSPLIDAEAHCLKIDWDDEIVIGTALTRDGVVVHPLLTTQGG